MSGVGRRLVVGLGCQRGTPVDALARALAQVLAGAGYALSEVGTLASSTRKQAERGLHGLAQQLNAELRFYDDDALAKASSQRDSVSVLQVAEPAARLAAQSAALLVPRTVVRDADTNLAITVAVARRAGGAP